MEGFAGVYVRHGPVLVAIADAASNDHEVEQLYRFGLVGGFVEAVAKRLGAGRARGKILPIDPEQTARALIWMNERYLLEMLSHQPQADPDVVVETLETIWLRALYGPSV